MKEVWAENQLSIDGNKETHNNAGVAQLVEQLICNQQVASSNLVTSSNHKIQEVYEST